MKVVEMKTCSLFFLVMFASVSAIAQTPIPFPTTLKEQRKILESDPEVLKYKKFRQEQAKNPEFPTYHFRAPVNFTGDANGFSYWQGRWHMFYQFRPHGTKRPDGSRYPVYWGHAVSPDLIHWQDLPIAIIPGKGNNAYSGSALVEKNRVLAIYHSTGQGNQVVESNDPLLLNWKNVPEKGVSIPNVKKDAKGYPYRVWDPFLYKDGGKYYSISGTYYGLGGRENDAEREPVWHLFESENLSKWDYKGTLLENDPFTTSRGDDGSCTYFWPLGEKADKHLLIFFSHRLGTQHFLGTFDKVTKKFTPEMHQFQHCGPSSSMPDPENEGSILIVNSIYNMENNLLNSFTLPRRLSLGENNTVLVEPVGDFASLRRNEKSFSNIDLTAKQVKIIAGVNGRELEIKTQILPGNSSLIDIDVFRSADGSKWTTLRLSRTKTSPEGVETWLVNFPQFPGKDHRGWSENPPEEPITFTRLSTEPIDLHLFLDRSLVEVYVNKQAFLPKYIYATENRTGVSIMVDGTGAKINSFKAWQMVAEIYKPKPEFGKIKEN